MAYAICMQMKMLMPATITVDTLTVVAQYFVMSPVSHVWIIELANELLVDDHIHTHVSIYSMVVQVCIPGFVICVHLLESCLVLNNAVWQKYAPCT